MKRSAVFVFSVLLSSVISLLATERTWTGSSSTDWFDGGNWTGGDGLYPQAADTVIIPSGASVLLTNETAALTSFSITNATLTFSNWTTRLRATTVNIYNNGDLTHAQVNTNVAPGVTNRVWVDCTTFNLEDGGKVNVAGKGFITEQGPGLGITCAGAGHGGVGGIRSGYAYAGGVYGSTNAPILPGSGGGDNGSSNPGGSGGGAVRIEAETAAINGTINANGGDGNSGGFRGGGSGGSIYLSCTTVSGNGTLSAAGGTAGGSAGRGGGGRIAVTYNTTSQAGVSPAPQLTCTVAPGSGGTTVEQAEMGSLYFSDGQLVPLPLDWNGELFTGDLSWTLTDLVVSNAQVAFPAGTTMDISGDLVVKNSRLDFAFSTANTEALSVGGALVLTNAASLYLYAAATNGAATVYGGLLDVEGNDSVIHTNCTIYPVSHSTDGGSIKMKFVNLTVVQGGAINADSLGYGDNLGPGGGGNGAGGGYGGIGGRRSVSYAVGGAVYGSTNAPAEPGSGGGPNGNPPGIGGNGGGLIWIDASSNLLVNGSLTANGENEPVNYSGGGSGGGIFILCDEFTGGSTAVMSADGGDSVNAGGGGGGRIAVAIGLSSEDRAKLLAGEAIDGLTVYAEYPEYDGDKTVDKGSSVGSGVAADDGTLRFLLIPSAGTFTLEVSGDPDVYSTPAPLDYGIYPGLAQDSEVTNSVVSPANESAGQRWSCIGWSLTNAAGAVDSGTSTQAIFTITTNLFLTWLWTNQYELTVESPGNGSVNSGTVNGWYTNGVSVTGITATASEGYSFNGWYGDVPPGSESDNPLTVTMGQARTINAAFASLTGETKVWDGNGSWVTAGNWDPPGMPGSLDNVILKSGTVVMGQAREMQSLVVSNTATLVFSNWTTRLLADTVTIRNGGSLTHAQVDTNAAPGVTNRVWVECSTFMMETGSTVNVSGKGFVSSQGPGTPGSQCNGAGHGGQGGRRALGYNNLGPVYGVTNAPILPGSGGGNNGPSNPGSTGGGAVRIDAGTATIYGTINANGANSTINYAGGGSGGSVYLTFDGLSGDGAISADGGDSGGGLAGGGGGGRIAVWVGVSDAARANYLSGTTNPVIRSATVSSYSGELTADLGSTTGDLAAEAGTKFFFTPKPVFGTLFMMR